MAKITIDSAKQIEPSTEIVNSVNQLKFQSTKAPINFLKIRILQCVTSMYHFSDSPSQNSSKPKKEKNTAVNNSSGKTQIVSLPEYKINFSVLGIRSDLLQNNRGFYAFIFSPNYLTYQKVLKRHFKRSRSPIARNQVINIQILGFQVMLKIQSVEQNSVGVDLVNPFFQNDFEEIEKSDPEVLQQAKYLENFKFDIDWLSQFKFKRSFFDQSSKQEKLSNFFSDLPCYCIENAVDQLNKLSNWLRLKQEQQYQKNDSYDEILGEQNCVFLKFANNRNKLTQTLHESLLFHIYQMCKLEKQKLVLSFDVLILMQQTVNDLENLFDALVHKFSQQKKEKCVILFRNVELICSKGGGKQSKNEENSKENQVSDKLILDMINLFSNQIFAQSHRVILIGVYDSESLPNQSNPAIKHMIQIQFDLPEIIQAACKQKKEEQQN